MVMEGGLATVLTVIYVIRLKWRSRSILVFFTALSFNRQEVEVLGKEFARRSSNAHYPNSFYIAINQTQRILNVKLKVVFSYSQPSQATFVSSNVSPSTSVPLEECQMLWKYN